ncbi:hypothetical protein SOVF_145200, partial [Spinacia oleracea]
RHEQGKTRAGGEERKERREEGKKEEGTAAQPGRRDSEAEGKGTAGRGGDGGCRVAVYAEIIMNSSVFADITLKFWHGGRFKRVGVGELVYMGGKCRTVAVDPDELCYFDLVDLAKKCGQYEKIAGLYYRVQGISLEDGLRQIFNDEEVAEIGELVVKCRTIELYVLHCDDEIVHPDTDPKHSQPLTHPSPFAGNAKKLTPKRAPPKSLMSPTKSSPRRQFQTTASNTNDNVTLSSPLKKTQTLASTLSKKDYFSTKYVASSSLVEPSLYKQIENPDVNTQAAQNTNFLSQNTNSTYDSSIPSDYEWEDPRPESPLKYNELISEDSDDDHDPLYKPDSGVLFHDSEDDDLNYEGEEGLNLEFEEGEEEEEENGRGSRGRGQGDDVGAFGRGSSGRGQGGGCAATGRGKGKGRGRGKGKNQVPVGVGVYIGADGTPFSNVS